MAETPPLDRPRQCFVARTDSRGDARQRFLTYFSAYAELARSEPALATADRARRDRLSDRAFRRAYD